MEILLIITSSSTDKLEAISQIFKIREKILQRNTKEVMMYKKETTIPKHRVDDRELGTSWITAWAAAQCGPVDGA